MCSIDDIRYNDNCKKAWLEALLCRLRKGTKRKCTCLDYSS